MSKTLYLIRHSYAESPGSKPDKDRELTAEGTNSIRSLGRYLLKSSFNPSIILCSSAQRTRDTAINLVEEIEMNEGTIQYIDSIYNASVRELLQVINELKSTIKEVALIGHNPSITYLAEYITGENIGNMDPSSMVTIDLEKQSWNKVSQNTGTLKNYFHPKNLNV